MKSISVESSYYVKSARRAKFGKVRLYTSLNSSAARFYASQIFLTSPRHAFPIAAALTKMVWHVGVRSFKCELMQALMRPAPGCTPPHCALTSAAHSFGTAATVLVAERKGWHRLHKYSLA